MPNVNERDLMKLEEELESIEVPKEALHQARLRAANQHRSERKRKHRLYSVISAAAIFILLFVMSVRVSPAFAQTVAKIPGLASIVEMIAYDKGIEDIVENNYFEELDIVVKEGDYTLTLQGVVADYSGMIVSYKLEAPFDLSKLESNEVFVSQQGTRLNASSTYSGPPSDETKVIEQKIEIVSSEGLSYGNKSFEFNLLLSDADKTKFTVPFTLTKPIEQPKVYEVNQSTVVDGQKIHIKQLKVSPSRAEIQLAIDEQNNMQILDFTSIKLVDEKGEDWGKIQNGIVGFGTVRDGEVSIFIQSNYFRRPKKLTLIMEKIEALPKGEDYIEIDFAQKKVLTVPDGLDIDIEVMSSHSIKVLHPIADSKHFKAMFSYGVDQDGNRYYPGHLAQLSSEADPYLESTHTFDFEKEMNLLRMYISNYPLYLDGKIEVDIPLD
ncbi:DUF4179 domain-containing protein [Cytobacillus sp. FJAT-53684]|uniref:DUF4179 domain-containing protein n=1 Tax=Cytobacillus mangrovibacter TaxID=3299024 RepID=A0ABW6K421_9BACI